MGLIDGRIVQDTDGRSIVDKVADLNTRMVDKVGLTYVITNVDLLKSDVADDLQSIINANKGKVIQLPLGTHKISKPLMIPLNTQLRGISGRWNDATGTTIQKTTLTTDLKFNVDAMIILDYETDESYHRSGKLLNLNLDGMSDTSRNAYGIYAKSGAFVEIKDVHVRYADQVFYTENLWQSLISMSGRYARKGIVFKSPISSGTGTSNVFERCFMSYIDDMAFDIYGLKYSVFNSCAADYVYGSCYVFNQSKGMVLNGCGTEYSMDAFDNWSSSITVNGLTVLHPQGKSGATSSAYLKTRQTGKSTFNSCDFGALENAGSTYNIICDQGGTMVFINTDKPTGGNGYISYSSGSKIIELGNAGLVVSP
jgi:hypothetical protein